MKILSRLVIKPYVTSRGGVVVLNGPFPIARAARIARLCEAAPRLLSSLKDCHAYPCAQERIYRSTVDGHPCPHCAVIERTEARP
ncbi:MAG: hypothetical protein A2Y38_11355 [Spirochaetes bacterium GWB1_59_5]|nr:MAG: hypothetical protein A2Y38_11355 [Spirochaetes bacterium GWB1_59_5]